MKVTIVPRLFTMLVIMITTNLLMVQSGYAQSQDFNKEKFKQHPKKALFKKADKGLLSSSEKEALTQLVTSKKTKKIDVVRMPDALYNETALTFKVDLKPNRLYLAKVPVPR